MKAGDFCNQNAGYGSMCARVGAYCPSCDRMQTCAISEHSHFVNDRIALRCEECRHIRIISRFDDVTPTVDHFRGNLVSGVNATREEPKKESPVLTADQKKVKFREFT